MLPRVTAVDTEPQYVECPRGPLVASRMTGSVTLRTCSIPHIPSQKGAAWLLPR